MRFAAEPAAAYSGDGYDLVTMFDCLHDMGDPVGAARHVRSTLAPDGTWMIVEPRAGDRTEDNFNPVGRAYYAFSTLLCTPGVALAGGRARARRAGRRGADPRRRRGGRVHALPPRGRDAVQPRLRGAALTLAGRPRSAPAAGAPREQSRARYPDAHGHVERDGVRIAYEVYGSDGPAVLLLPAWSIVHSRMWKAQIPYLARHCRVVTFDGRGNGRSDRPVGASAYADAEFTADALAVMDATGLERATLVGLSAGARWGSLLAAGHPERVDGLVAIAPARPAAGPPRRCVRGGAEPRRRVGDVRPPFLHGGLSRVPRVLLRAGVQRAALDQADRGRHRLGARDDARDAGLHGPRGAAGRRRAARGDARAHPLPRARHPGRRRPHLPARAGCGVRRRHGRGAAHARGRRPPADRQGSGADQPGAARRHRAAAARHPPAARPGPRAGARSSSPRPSGSGTRGATSRSRTSSACSIPSCRSTGSPSIR